MYVTCDDTSLHCLLCYRTHNETTSWDTYLNLQNNNPAGQQQRITDRPTSVTNIITHTGVTKDLHAGFLPGFQVQSRPSPCLMLVPESTSCGWLIIAPGLTMHTAAGRQQVDYVLTTKSIHTCASCRCLLTNNDDRNAAPRPSLKPCLCVHLGQSGKPTNNSDLQAGTHVEQAGLHSPHAQ